MSSEPRGRRRWAGFPNNNRSRLERTREHTELESGPESPVARKAGNLLEPRPQTLDSQTELSEIETRRSAALKRKQEKPTMTGSQEEQAKVDEENLAMEMKDISLGSDPEKDFEMKEDVDGSSRLGDSATHGRARSPSPFHGVLELGHMSGRAPYTFLENSCRHRTDFDDTPTDEEEENEEYDILVHSDVWSNSNVATSGRAQRCQLPPPLRNLRTETQEDNRPTPISFDDYETLHIPSDPSSPPTPDADRWDGWFLSDTPQETYSFENDYPYAAPLLRKIIALPRNKKVELMTAAAVGTWKELACGLDKAIRLGRFAVNGVVLNTRDLRVIAEERVLDWAPGLFEAMWNMATGPFLPGIDF